MKIGKYETNNIYNEDCYKALKNIPDKSIDLIYVDIPYELHYACDGSMDSKISQETRKVFQNNKHLTSGIDYSIFDEFCRIMKNIYLYVWCSKNQVYEIMNYFVNKNCNYNILVWCKDNAMPFGNCNFLSDKEFCLCFSEKGCKFNQGWEHKSTFYVSHINYNDKKLFEHPTIKPYDFVKQHILNSTNKGDIVLDCFLGSGTTACVCKELDRQYIGFEIDEKYFKIAQDRLNGISQKDRKQEEMGIQTIFDYIGG